jgi:type IV secretion system protein VirB9
MKPHALWLAVLAAHAAGAPIQEVTYSPTEVITVPVALGVPTRIELDSGEAITKPPHAGLGSDCDKPEHPWCLYWSPGDTDFVVKPKSSAQAGMPNNVSIRTAKRSYDFVFKLGPAAKAVHRLLVRPPQAPELSPAEQLAQGRMQAALAVMPQPGEVVEQRLASCPKVVNADYTVATGAHSEDIVPHAVFDDGRFTYLSYPDNRPVPAVIQVDADGNKRVVNQTMDCGFVAIDRVAREFWLRHGEMVVSIRNNAYDLNGRGPVAGTTAEGVQRLVRDPRTGTFKEQR